MSNDLGLASAITKISPVLADRISEEIGQNVYLCYQCVKCSSGCPLGGHFDWQPHQIMRAVQFGDEKIALESETIWLCASCQTCTTRCPQDLDITAIMEFLTRESKKRGIKPAIPMVDISNTAFTNEIKLWGRSYEPGVFAEIKLRSGDLLSDIDFGAKLFIKQKVALFPEPTRAPKNVKPIPAAADSIAYYPGCSLHSTAKEFDISTKAVCKALGLNLLEPKGWLCCGSSPAHKSDPELALELPMENLRIFEQSGFHEVTMPCAACFNRHKAAQHEIRTNDSARQEIAHKFGYEYQDKVVVHTVSETILNHLGVDEVTELVKKPLKDLNLVCYYGCLLTRPPVVTEVEHHENPVDLDYLMEASGANVIDWSYKTMCCGASHSLSRPDIVIDLSRKIIQHAKESGADAIVVACPLCHMNLDARQFQMELDEPMPILYFTQLLALALNLPEKEMCLYKNLVDPRPVLTDKGLL